MPVAPATLAGHTTRRDRVDRCGTRRNSGADRVFLPGRHRTSHHVAQDVAGASVPGLVGQYSFHDGLMTGHRRHRCKVRDRDVRHLGRTSLT